jgi:hypothetical protein
LGRRGSNRQEGGLSTLKEQPSVWQGRARLRWLMALMVVICTSIGTYFAYKQIGIYSASATIKIGTLGVLSWTESPPVEECERENAERLMACYSSFVRGAMSSIGVPIESTVSVWRRLYKEYDIYSARRGEIPMPIVYSVDFGEGSEVLSLGTRGKTQKDAVNLLEKILDDIIQEHSERAQRHRSFLRSYADRVEKIGDPDDVNNGFKGVSPGEKLAIFSAINIASQHTYETSYIATPRLIPRTMNPFWLRVISGFVIGLILAGFLSVFGRALRIQ